METPATTHLDPLRLSRLREIAGPENVVTEATALEKLSKDYYWFSPILKKQLEAKRGEAAVRASSVETLKAIVGWSCSEGIPVTLRGAGTGNYGQCIPLYGGIILDLSPLATIHSLEDGVVHCETGARIGTIEAEARKKGYEMRCMPSTWVKSTIGGFICGGSAGMGGVTYGGTAVDGMVKSLRILSVEPEPRFYQYHEEECLPALNTFGTTGIVTDLEIRLAPKHLYNQHIIVHEDWDALFHFGHAIANDKSLHKRLLTGLEDRLSRFFKPIRPYLPEGKHSLLIMIDEGHSDALLRRAAEAGMECTHTIPATDPLRPPYLSDYGWNHTMLWVIKEEPEMTYVQLDFGNDPLGKMRKLKEAFGDEIYHHLEWTRATSKWTSDEDDVVAGGAQLLRFSSRERLEELNSFCEANGIFVADCHVYELERGSHHPDLEAKRALKHKLDPGGLLNPGKMTTYPVNPFEEAASV
jgi:FAD/FMN-containing dehydrogenase